MIDALPDRPLTDDALEQLDDQFESATSIARFGGEEIPSSVDQPPMHSPDCPDGHATIRLQRHSDEKTRWLGFNPSLVDYESGSWSECHTIGGPDDGGPPIKTENRPDGWREFMYDVKTVAETLLMPAPMSAGQYRERWRLDTEFDLYPTIGVIGDSRVNFKEQTIFIHQLSARRDGMEVMVTWRDADGGPLEPGGPGDRWIVSPTEEQAEWTEKRIDLEVGAVENHSPFRAKMPGARPVMSAFDVPDELSVSEHRSNFNPVEL